MGEPAAPAPDRKVPASNRKIVRVGNMTIPAFCGLDKFPEIIAPDLCVRSRLCHIMYPWDKNPGCPAVVTRYLSLIGNRLDDLVCRLFAVITVRAVFCKDEPVAHVRYWMRTGSLICCWATYWRIKKRFAVCSLRNCITNGPDTIGRWQFFVLQQKGSHFLSKFKYKAITM